MFLAVVVDGCFQAQLLVNRFLERVAEVGHLLDELDEFFELQTKEHRGRDGADGYC